MHSHGILDQSPKCFVKCMRQFFYLALGCVCYEAVQITNDELMPIYSLLKMDAQVIAHFCTKENCPLIFLFHKKKSWKGGPDPKVLYMCSSSDVKKALNQLSVKRHSQ